MTSVDLIMAETLSPIFNFISSALRFSDYALDEVLADANDDMSHYSAELKLNNFAFKMVPS